MRKTIIDIIYKDYENKILNASKCSKKYFMKHHKNIYNQLYVLYNNDYCFSEILYLYLNDLNIRPTCLNCGIEITKFRINTGYSTFCCKNCANKYNAETSKNNRIEKYGYFFNNKEKADQTKLEKYNDITYNNRSKAHDTMIKIYGAKTTGESIILTDKVKKTNNEKYGTDYSINNDEVKLKIKNIFIEKYNTESPFGSDIIREKSKATLLEKYNVEHPLQNEEIKDKWIKTNNEKYGTDYSINNDEVKKKIDITNLKRYNTIYPSQNIIIKDKIRKKHINKYIEKYKDFNIEITDDFNILNIKNACTIHTDFLISKSVFYHRLIRYDVELCTKCYPTYRKALTQHKITEYLNSKNIKVEPNNRKILNGKEIDIYLPDYNLGIEYNGSYYHCTLNKDKNYHIDKTILANNQNINIFHIHECDFKTKPDIILSMINSKIKINNNIYARKCVIKQIKKQEEYTFLHDNHLKGYAISTICYGLYYKNELVSIMSFCKLRKNLGSVNDNTTYELLRYCSKLNHNVTGGASKLLKHFEKNNLQCNKIITYADRDFSDGNMYKQLNFTFLNYTAPGYFYTDNKHNKINRYNVRKDILVKQGYDKNKTETQIMIELGYYKIYTTGNLKFVKYTK